MVNTQQLLLAPDLVATQFGREQENHVAVFHNGNGMLTIFQKVFQKNYTFRFHTFRFQHGLWNEITFDSNEITYDSTNVFNNLNFRSMGEYDCIYFNKEVTVYQCSSNERMWSYTSARDIRSVANVGNKRMVIMLSHVDHLIVDIETGEILYEHKVEDYVPGNDLLFAQHGSTTRIPDRHLCECHNFVDD